MDASSTIEDPLWIPTAEIIARANLTHYMRWLETNRGLRFKTYPELWQWSVDHIDDFWESLFPYFNLVYSHPWSQVLPERMMPGARWFPGVELNYAENIFAKSTP